MTKKLVQDLRIGDVIMPPPIDVRGWMRRKLTKRALPESALYLTITEITEAKPDKAGRWIKITALHPPEWFAGGESWPFTFEARPTTSWIMAEQDPKPEC